jgi:hypothetical protein
MYSLEYYWFDWKRKSSCKAQKKKRKETLFNFLRKTLIEKHSFEAIPFYFLFLARVLIFSVISSAINVNTTLNWTRTLDSAILQNHKVVCAFDSFYSVSNRDNRSFMQFLS